MIERTQLRFDLEELRSAVQAVRCATVWFDGQIGLSTAAGMTHANEDNPYGDINYDCEHSTGPYSSPHGLDAWRLAPVLADTAVATILGHAKALTPSPFRTGRVRLFLVEPGEAKPMRCDGGFAYVAAVNADPEALVLINTGEGSPKRMNEGNLPLMRTYHIAADGHTYILDATKHHTFVNTGNNPAIYVVVESDRRPMEQPKWTGLTTEAMTGHQDSLETGLRPNLVVG